MNKKLLLFFLLTILTPYISLAQVDDVSFIVSPKAGYNWFDNNSTVDNGLMYGFDAGFSFGNIFELRGIYRHSEDLSQTFGEYQDDISDFLNNDDFSFNSRDISVRRFGGELKANILPGKFSPYITLGTGVQRFKRDLSDGQTNEIKTIYASTGLGIKLNFTQRISFDIEGKTIINNLDPKSFLYDPNSTSEVDDFLGGLNSERMYNWAVTAGLSFYLGGIDRKELTPLEKAYLQRYSGNLYGVKISLAPAGSYINFDNKSDFKDAFMVGGNLGIDFNDYFGLQGYYYHSTKGKDISFDFDKMAMFGLDFVGRLNIPRGIVPYVTVGGGYINTYGDYHGKFYDDNSPSGNQNVDSKFYAKGGLGVEIPVSTNLSLFGSASLLYTKGDENADIADLSSVDQLRQHNMFTGGLRVRFGKKAETREATQRAFEDRFQPTRRSYEQKVKDLQEKLNEAYEESDSTKVKEIMRQKEQLEHEVQGNHPVSEHYDQKIDSLKTEYMVAFKNGDIDKAKQIMEKKKEIEARNDSLNSAKGIVRMTPEELQSLINNTVNKVVQESDTTTIKERLDRIERLILNLSNEPNRQSPPPPSVRPDQQKETQSQSGQEVETPKSTALGGELNRNIEKLNESLQSQIARIDQLMQELRTQDRQVTIQERNAPVVRTPAISNGNNIITYNNGRQNSDLAAFIGYSFGDKSSVNIGLRKYYGLEDTPIFLMGEGYIAVAEHYGLGASANAVYPFKLKSKPLLTPYAGLGLGINFVDGNFGLNPNFIIGTFYKLENSNSLIFDYTIRGSFKYNQLSIGYKFSL